MKKIKINNMFLIIKSFVVSIKIISKINKFFIMKKIISVLIQSFIVFSYPYILKTFLDGIENDKPANYIIFSTILVVLLCCILNIISSILNNSLTCDINKINTCVIRDFNELTLDANYELLERPETQDMYELAKRSLREDGGILGLSTKVADSIGKLVSFLIAGVVIINVNPFLVLIIIFLAIIKIFIEKHKQKIRKRDMRDKTPPIMRKINYCNSVSRNLIFAKDIRVYNIGNLVDEKRKYSVKEYLKILRKFRKKMLIVSVIVMLLNTISSISMYLFMIDKVIKGMPISSFTFGISSVGILVSSINHLILNYGHAYGYSLEVSDYLKYTKSNIFEKLCENKHEFNEMEIEFKHVYYSYYMQEDYVLKDVSFKIKFGEKIALIGLNGAGKTTLIKLMCGLYKPTKGEILINGININNISKQELYRFISPVFQDNVIFAMSIFENIVTEDFNSADIDKLTNSIQLMNLDKKINSLNNKVDSIISREFDEDGIDLSGGESQKVSIARVIYKESQIVILDEPTSALDPIEESKLYNNINKIIKNRTCIFISHRLSSTKFCDKILLLVSGEIKEEGTHNELMSYDSQYKQLFDMQSKYYKFEVDNE